MEEKKLEKYSFSKLSAFHTCRYGYKLTYIDHIKGNGNAFAEYGTFVHSLMERYANNRISLWDLPSAYENEFDSEVKMDFPTSEYCKDMRDLYYQQGLAFLKNFMGYDKFKILEVEADFSVQIDDWIFTGIMDLLYEDEQGGLIILDYKSKSSFKNKAELYKYARQLYLYCLYVKEKYGKYPSKLKFYTFRKQTQVDIPFNEDDFVEAVVWAKSTVKQIRECTDFSPCCEEFFGANLCNHRFHCDKKKKKPTRR